MAFPFIPLAFASGSAIFGALGARSASKRIEKAAKANMEAIDDEITQVRIRSIDEMIGLSRRGRGITGEAQTVFAGRSGLSVNEILATLAADVAEDSAVLRRNRENAVDSLQAQKTAIVNQAQSQMQNPLLAGVSAGLAGFSTGMEIGGAFNAVQAAKEAIKTNRTMFEFARVGGVMDQAAAIMLRTQTGLQFGAAQYGYFRARADLNTFQRN